MPLLKGTKNILKQFGACKGQVAVLIDPDKSKNEGKLLELLNRAQFAKVDYLFIGGSTVSNQDFQRTVEFVRAHSSLPLVIFPGGPNQLSESADALLYLSLISGRNPDFLIGHHVQTAHELFDMQLEIIPTAYILVDGGVPSSVAYVSQTTPIPQTHHSIILNTAKAGILQGKQLIFLDAGSGAKNAVPPMIVAELVALHFPIIVGGGIRSKAQMTALKKAGANVIVIGNKLESDIEFLMDIQEFIAHHET